jgi:hypothetical protein
MAPKQVKVVVRGVDKPKKVWTAISLARCCSCVASAVKNNNNNKKNSVALVR